VCPCRPFTYRRDVFVLSYRQRVAAQVELEPWEMVQRPIDLGKAERNDVSPDSPRPWL
jgi:hypothetical protein